MQLVHKNLLVFLFLGIFLVTSVSATIYEVNTTIQIPIVCINAGFCSSSTVCNASIFAPDGSTVISGVQATQSADLAFFNITLNSTQNSNLGEHQVGGFCKDGSVTQIIDFTYDVTNFGTKIENSGFLYSSLLLIIFFLNLLIFYIIFMLRSENFRNEEGEFVGVSLVKYIRMVLIGISYGLVLLTLNLMHAAANTLTEITQFAGILGGLFLLMLNGSWIWTSVIMIWIAITIWTDGNLIKEMQTAIDERLNKL